MTTNEPSFNVVAWFLAVQKVWGQAKPTADFAWKKYSGLHNLVVVGLWRLTALHCDAWCCMMKFCTTLHDITAPNLE